MNNPACAGALSDWLLSPVVIFLVSLLSCVGKSLSGFSVSGLSVSGKSVSGFSGSGLGEAGLRLDSVETA
ncbi:hypothetical protein ACJJI5_05030 [Microbulbifer sp. EKSA008]|uniref:hypothetical protein n=1 Tax=Microbulbifer sp. EKSA008 TaxID=3243367 RepID=UPI0040435D9A